MIKIALIVYYVLACALLPVLLRKGRGSGSGIAAITMFIPFAGLPAALVSLRGAMRKLPPDADLSRFEIAVGVARPTEDVPHMIDVAKEVNIVPIEEALAISDFRARRRLMLDVLKEDPFPLRELLAKAARNEDSETSHYAVTALLELKREMMAELARWSLEAEREPNDPAVLAEYAAVLKRYTGSGLMEERMQRTHQMLLADLLKRMDAVAAGSEEMYLDWVECELALGRQGQAIRAAERFLEAYPESEKAYYAALKLHYTLRSGRQFLHILDRLKRSPVKVSHSTLQVIRYWSQGVKI